MMRLLSSKRIIRRAFGDDRGAAMVELAICLPFLVLLLIGFTEFGRAIWDHHILDKSIRDAVRYLSIVPDPTASSEQGNATTLALHGSLDPAAPLLIADLAASDVTFSMTPVDNSSDTWNGPSTIYVISGTITYPFSSSLLSAIGLGSLTMVANHVERSIGE